MAAKPPVVWSPEARADLSTIWDYYSNTADPTTADDIVRKIGQVVGLLRKLAGYVSSMGVAISMRFSPGLE
jgi:plasmid stabilization system protein ParE